MPWRMKLDEQFGRYDVEEGFLDGTPGWVSVMDEFEIMAMDYLNKRAPAHQIVRSVPHDYGRGHGVALMDEDGNIVCSIELNWNRRF